MLAALYPIAWWWYSDLKSSSFVTMETLHQSFSLHILLTTQFPEYCTNQTRLLPTNHILKKWHFCLNSSQLHWFVHLLMVIAALACNAIMLCYFVGHEISVMIISDSIFKSNSETFILVISFMTFSWVLKLLYP